MKLITINRDYDILLKDTISNYLSPNYVYLPIKNNTKLLIDPKEKIYKGDKVLNYVFSPVSGKILGTKILTNEKNIKQKYLVIENDFKEKTKSRLVIRKNIGSLSKEKFLEIVNEVDEELYNKLNVETNKIIVDSIENEPYVGNSIYINRYFTKEVLETIDALIDIYNANKISILVKESDIESIEELSKQVGMFPKISLQYLPNKYLINDNEILCKTLNINENFIHLTIEDIYKINNIVKRKKCNEEKLITITGNAIRNPQVVNVKIGTLLKNVIEELIEFKKTDYDFIINGLVGGLPCDINSIVISEDIRAIFIMKKNNIVEEKCISCGKCNEVCPKNINVYNFVNNKKCDTSNCIKCGLCSYICPSYINIKEKINGDNNE